MVEVVIYTTPFCAYCLRVKDVLKRKRVRYEEFDVFLHPGRRHEMTMRAKGRRTVPQIFIDGSHVGGCEELVALDRAGKLDPLLGAK